ncbi:hypothetical protein BKA62DRAFT_698715 [Auriculariales sp. MPI-PUGE-AT-0066]|nr:hypothetical protein BKA62DRAFT_698715 [Auriculariales sp. MPI-PUGE-AT-0066]
MEGLPLELVAYILQLVAYALRSTDRIKVVQLASTSSFVYEAVAPILYERIVIKAANAGAFSALIKNEAAATRILSHARFLHADASCVIMLSSAAALFVNVQAIFGSVYLWNEIARVQARCGTAIASDLRVYTNNLLNNLREVHQPHLRSLTRLHACLPLQSMLAGDGTGWTRSMLDLLPCLTHLGFSAKHINPSTARDIEMEVLAEIMQTVAASQQPCIEMFAVNLVGQAALYWDAYVRIAQNMKGDWALRCMWFRVDSRVINDWFAEDPSTIHDAQKELSIWTEATPLRWHLEIIAFLGGI